MLEAIAYDGFVGGDEYADFEANWSRGCDLATLRSRDGVGVCYLVFSPAGALICGYDPRAPIAAYEGEAVFPPGLIEGVPTRILRFVADAEFWHDEYGNGTVTVCLWREVTDDRWHHGAVDLPEGTHDADGANALLDLVVDPSPETYLRWTEERDGAATEQAAREVYALHPLTRQLVVKVNADASLTGLAPALTRIGYPHATDDLRPGLDHAEVT